METVSQNKEEINVEAPPLYQVILLNDDYTTMDFVVEVLQKFFEMNIEKATKVMMKVHTEGKAMCGIYDKDIAETRCYQVNSYSRKNQQILKAIVEVMEK